MPTMIVEIKRLPPKENAPEVRLPEYATPEAAGADVFAPYGVVIFPGERVMLPLGFAVSIPAGFEIQFRPRSGLAAKHGVTVINSPGTIDSDYRGELIAALVNHGGAPHTIHAGDRVAQMVLAPVYRAEFHEVDALTETVRGTGGFGSTGR